MTKEIEDLLEKAFAIQKQKHWDDIPEGIRSCLAGLYGKEDGLHWAFIISDEQMQFRKVSEAESQANLLREQEERLRQQDDLLQQVEEGLECIKEGKCGREVYSGTDMVNALQEIAKQLQTKIREVNNGG